MSTPRWSLWRTIVAFGVVSLLADMVYEAMRATSGPFLAQLGASALVVGLVTGAGEAVALGLRLVTGPAADRSGMHWRFTVVGYAMTAVSVPLLAFAPFVGAAGVGLASVLILLERTGKAVRSPSKSALLARMTTPVGRGRGFGVHKAPDQIGAFAGPLLVAGIAAWTGHLWVAFVVLAVPGAGALVLLGVLRRRAPLAVGVAPAPAGTEDLPEDHPEDDAGDRPTPPREPLPRAFGVFSAACALVTLGLMTFGVISFAWVADGTLTAAWVPVVYAGAMAVEAVAALGTGWAYDRVGSRVLLALPVLVAAVPALAFAHELALVLVGTALWALATGIQDSTVKALVADLVPAGRLGSAYGTFAAAMGVAALAGGTLAGALHADHLGLLVAVVAAAQVLALGLLVVTLRRIK